MQVRISTHERKSAARWFVLAALADEQVPPCLAQADKDHFKDTCQDRAQDAVLSASPTRYKVCHGFSVAPVGCTAILRLTMMLPSARPRPRDASSVCGCSSSMRLFSQLDTRNANSIPGPRLLEGASACIQCFVRRETASVRAVVRLWREDAGQGMTKTSDYCSAAPLRACQSSELGLSRTTIVLRTDLPRSQTTPLLAQYVLGNDMSDLGQVPRFSCPPRLAHVSHYGKEKPVDCFGPLLECRGPKPGRLEFAAFLPTLL